MNIVAKHIVFSGRVQGVGFRFTALNIANRYHLTGYVKNLPGGAVEMLAQGPEDIINNSISDIRDSFAGCVRDVEVEDAAVDPQLKEFKITF